MQSTRLSRVMRLVHTLYSCQPLTAEALSETLNCSKRTVFRDLRLLADSGFPNRFDKSAGGFVFDLKIANHSLTPEEELSLLLAAETSFVAGIAPFRSSLKVASQKIQNQASPDALRRLRIIKGIFGHHQVSFETVYDQTRFWRIVDAISTRRQLHLRWKPIAMKEPLTLLFCPYRLDYEHSGWQVVGRSSIHYDEVVALSLYAICQAEPNGHTYRLPGSFRRLRVEGPVDPLPVFAKN